MIREDIYNRFNLSIEYVIIVLKFGSSIILYK